MTPVQTAWKLQAELIIKGLKKRQMEGYYAATKEEAVSIALSLMPEGSSVGWGGSVTLTECGLMDALKTAPLQVIDRAQAVTPEEKDQMNARLITADTFLMSTNAITMDGELFNIDGHGSRLAFLIYGPKQVLVLCGMNKVVSSLEAAQERARLNACPPNCIRLNKKTPCAVTGRCGDCYGSDCICSQFVTTRRSSIPGRIKVILIGESLGF